MVVLAWWEKREWSRWQSCLWIALNLQCLVQFLHLTPKYLPWSRDSVKPCKSSCKWPFGESSCSGDTRSSPWHRKYTLNFLQWKWVSLIWTQTSGSKIFDSLTVTIILMSLSRLIKMTGVRAMALKSLRLAAQVFFGKWKLMKQEGITQFGWEFEYIRVSSWSAHILLTCLLISIIR